MVTNVVQNKEQKLWGDSPKSFFFVVHIVLNRVLACTSSAMKPIAAMHFIVIVCAYS